MRHLISGFALAMLVAGCSHRPPNPATPDVVYFVHGAGGEGATYDGLITGLREGGVARQIDSVEWGMGGPLFIMNFQNTAVHADAEAKLAEVLRDRATRFPGRGIDLLAHSAGCGVVLGALGRDGVPHVRNVVLLHPSVSPTYSLGIALAKVDGSLHVFHSDRDTFFLEWRTGTFGTYDNVKTKAAGNTGFASLAELPAPLRSKLIQHPYEAAYESLGNDGGHFGAIARLFSSRVLAPLLGTEP